MITMFNSKISRVFLFIGVILVSFIRILSYSNNSFIGNDGVIYLLINIFLVFLLMLYINDLSKKRMPKIIFVIIILKVYQLVISFVRGSDIDLAFITRAIFPELLMVLIFYSVQDKSVHKRLLAFFTIFITFFLSLNFFISYLEIIDFTNISGLNSIYWLVFMIPFILMLKNTKLKLFLSILVMLCVIFSFKLTALIAMFVAYLIYLIGNNDNEFVKKRFRKTNFVFYVIIGLLFLYLVFTKTFWAQKMINAIEFGGSGRLDIWRESFITILNSNIIEILLGHGFNSIISFIGFSSHNDFIELLFSYGLFGFSLYISIFYLHFVLYIKMKKNNYFHSKLYIVSVIIFFVISLFSHVYFLDFSYLPLMFWAYIIADYNMFLRKKL